MKYDRILAFVVLGLAGGPLIGVSAIAQEAAQKKHVQATDEFQHAKKSAQKQASVYQDKIQALRKSVEALGMKRAELAKAKGKESEEVANLTARMDKLKKQAVELREMAKTNAMNKTSQANERKIQVAKKVSREKQNVDKQKTSKSGDAEKDESKIRQTDQIVGAKKGKPAIAATDSDDHPMIGGGKAKLHERKPHPPGQVEERRVIVREGVSLKGKRPVDGPGAQRNIEIDREKQRTDRGPSREQSIKRSAGPGPVEVTRRLHVLEDRLNAIERKFDEILERLSDRGPRLDDYRSERGPRPGQGGPETRVRRQVNENAPQERRSPNVDRPRERREGSPPGVDDDQLRRPPKPDEAPSPPRGDGPPRR